MKLLLISANAGAGHIRAAAALEEAARDLHPEAEIRNVDILSFTDPIYRRAYANSWLKMADNAPALWGYIYSSSDKAKAKKKQAALVRAFDRIEFRKFRKFVADFSPQVVIATHFLPGQILATSRKEMWGRFKFGCVLTDFDAHVLWAQPSFDRFFVGNEELVEILADKGMKRESITVTGIPIINAFAQPLRRQAAREKLGLRDDAPIVLCMGGGMGLGNMDTIVEAVVNQPPVQVLAVAGKNAKLKRDIEALKIPRGSDLRVFGFVDNIPEMMAAADIAVSKSGGLSSSECLAMGLPMLVPNPIPGQEERNADFLAESGAAFKARGLGSFRYKLRRLLSEPELRAQMAQNAKRLGKPGAARSIIEAMLG
ncbi:processive 1,2-diacylglycerol beta-glucosyltransferase [Planctomycetaceae bacterium]|nr:processive 1,2-diacylglycerol beta-glucosyltransferase [Planctomycetaceae bacterium]